VAAEKAGGEFPGEKEAIGSGAAAMSWVLRSFLFESSVHHN
jgi:hypothetical protein